ncbi:histidine phosphatase family protein [Mycobacterium sp.]|uniref:histidine phosphatase family protein n=1 Tax=Mycobacterium sp. TaxID=1785 RepID=UPI0031DAE197
MPNSGWFANSSKKRFCYVAVAAMSAVLPFVAAATAWADEEDMVLDLVRHGQSVANVTGILNTLVPGPELTELGHEQADAVAKVLAPGAPYDGIYASDMIRTQETAAPLAEMLHVSVTDLAGLDEVNSGIYEGLPLSVHGIPIVELLYGAAPLAWTLGLEFVPELGSTDPNGIAFDERYTAAIDTIYNAGGAVNSQGDLTDVAFSHEVAITTWTLLNVGNPDFPLVFDEFLHTRSFLPNTGIVVLQGNPEVGWTLVSWNGEPVPPASLPVELFVDTRNFIMAPQLAAYNIGQAVATGDPTTIVSALQTGAYDVGAATLNFPVAVIRDIVDAVRDALPGALSLGDVPADLASLPGDVSAMAGQALAMF